MQNRKQEKKFLGPKRKKIKKKLKLETGRNLN